jgi:hypothetical protein
VVGELWVVGVVVGFAVGVVVGFAVGVVVGFAVGVGVGVGDGEALGSGVELHKGDGDVEAASVERQSYTVTFTVAVGSGHASSAHGGTARP